mmetsp:Transcript_14245/g.39242  ORF Transcript_14245/g.39242 Transcript_14245/m.39242 type:complete len:183 (-) Transcript_14245:1168-1716(-)
MTTAPSTAEQVHDPTAPSTVEQVHDPTAQGPAPNESDSPTTNLMAQTTMIATPCRGCRTHRPLRPCAAPRVPGSRIIPLAASTTATATMTTTWNNHLFHRRHHDVDDRNEMNVVGRTRRIDDEHDGRHVGNDAVEAEVGAAAAAEAVTQTEGSGDAVDVIRALVCTQECMLSPLRQLRRSPI